MSEPTPESRTRQSERRAVVRFSYFADALGHCAGDAVTVFFEGQILDLSTNGVGLRIHRKLEPGVTVTLTLKHATGIFQCERTARVIHAHAVEDGGWVIGCEFTVPLTQAEIRWFQVQDFSRPDAVPS